MAKKDKIITEDMLRDARKRRELIQAGQKAAKKRSLEGLLLLSKQRLRDGQA